MRLSRLISPALAVSALASLDASALEPREVFKLVEPAMVVVYSEQSRTRIQGSGILVGPTDVLTSCHVVTGSGSITVEQGNVTRGAKVRFQDDARDLCQLRLDDSIPKGRTIEQTVPVKDLEPGQVVYAISSPRGLENTISRGIVSGLRSQPGEAAKLVQTDAAISPGSSGGGLFDESGRLVGLISFHFKDEGLNFALPTDWIAELSTRNRDRLGDAQRPVASGKTTDEALPPWLPRAGSRFVYELLSRGKRVRTVNIDVVAARGEAVSERITVEGYRSFRAEREVRTQALPNEFQKIVGLPGGYNFVELQPYLEPSTNLRAGQQWDNVPVEFLIPGVGRRDASFTVKTIGQEDVKVAAGSYSAWKVQATAFERHYGGNMIRIVCTFWYAPSAARTVRMSVLYDTEIGTLKNEDVFELMSEKQPR